MNETKPHIRYSLNLIELRESHIYSVPPADETASGLNFNVNLENAVEEQNGWILCTVTVNLATQKSAVVVGRISATLSFVLEDFAALVTKNDQGLAVIPPELLATLNGISISTTRGIMYGVFKGTPLHGALLPLFDVKTFAPELPLEGK